MIFQCNDLERALRTPELMRDARAHAEQCERCRQELFLWSEISRLAPQLHQEWESPGLWPRIRAEMQAVEPKRGWHVHWRWAIAAAAVVALAVAVSLPWQSRPRSQTFLTDRALREVQQTEAAYTKSIDRLASVAEPSLESSPSPLAAAYREKLTVLDSAIADLRNSVEDNRYNLYLQTQLASLYREKQKTLEDWLAHANRN
jgi:hypothetical protein